MQLDPRRLRFLLAVARFGGVLAAADELRVTPSAVSQQLARLESETGLDLVRRTPGGLVLTPAGVTVAEAGEEVERVLNLAVARLRQPDDQLTGTIRIGGFTSFLATVLIPRLPAWRSRFPGLRFEIMDDEQADLLRLLRSGSLDAVVVELDTGEKTPSMPRRVTEIPLLDEPWRLVVPTGTLVGATVDLGRLPLPWLGVHPVGAWAAAVKRVREAAGRGDDATVHTYFGTQTALAMVAAGEGVALVPALALHGLEQPGIDTLDVPGLGTRRVVLWASDRPAPGAEVAGTAATLIRAAAAEFSWSEPSVVRD